MLHHIIGHNDFIPRKNNYCKNINSHQVIDQRRALEIGNFWGESDIPPLL